MKKANMTPSIIALIAVILAAIIVLYLFLIPLISVVVNFAILYFVFLRIASDITKYQKKDTYILSGIAGILLTILIGKFLPVWQITSAVVFAWVLNYLYHSLIR